MGIAYSIIASELQSHCHLSVTDITFLLARDHKDSMKTSRKNSSKLQIIVGMGLRQTITKARELRCAMLLSQNHHPADSTKWVERLKDIWERFVAWTRNCTKKNPKLASKIAEGQTIEAALGQAEKKYRSIFENAIEGIFQTTPDGHYITANPALARIYGYSSPEELKSQISNIRLQLYVDPNQRTEFLKQIQEKGSVWRFESQIYRADGEIVWISENARAVNSETGELLYYEGTVEDITHRKQVEEALRLSETQLKVQADRLEQALQQLQCTQGKLIQTEKMSSLGQMVAGVAHEINNPVSFVCGNITHANQYTQDLLYLLSLYQKHYPQPVSEIQQAREDIDLEFLLEDLPKTFKSMQLGADRIREIVLSLRNFSRLDEAQMKPINIYQGIDSTLLILQNRLKASADRPEIKICKEYGDIPLIECYGGQLNQVFMNLLSNAIDALEQRQQDCKIASGESNKPPDPAIKICTRVVEGDHLEIRISDNGPGMTEETRAQLFDPFFTTKPAGKGTGLGLSISYQIVVEKHGGKLTCNSQLGQGAEFKIALPINSENSSSN